jgi:hypothetical protein
LKGEKKNYIATDYQHLFLFGQVHPKALPNEKYLNLYMLESRSTSVTAVTSPSVTAVPNSPGGSSTTGPASSPTPSPLVAGFYWRSKSLNDSLGQIRIGVENEQFKEWYVPYSNLNTTSSY